MSKVFKATQEISRVIIGMPTKKRISGVYHNEISNSFGEWIITAKETINAFDFKVLSAFLTSIYENRQQFVDIQNLEFYLTSRPDTVEKFSKKTFSFTIDLYQFAKEYMCLSRKSIGGKTYKAIIESFLRLQTLNIFGRKIDSKTKTKSAFNLIPLPFVRIEEKENKYKIELQFYGALLLMFENKEALFINNEYIQKAKSRVATFLVFFLMTQKKAKVYSLSFLEKTLNMHSQDKNRTTLRDIRKAFNELVKIGFLKSWSEEKRNDDIYFHFTRNRKQDKKPGAGVKTLAGSKKPEIKKALT